MTLTERRYGAQSMTADLRDALVARPGPAFGRAFDDPAHGFLRPVDLERARREHDGLVDTLDRLGVSVHVLGDEIVPAALGRAPELRTRVLTPTDLLVAVLLVTIAGLVVAPSILHRGHHLHVARSLVPLTCSPGRSPPRSRRPRR